MRPIVDLLHHTSVPRWLRSGLGDQRFAAAFLRFVEAFSARYRDVREYTLFNEPYSTLFLAGHEGVWPPHWRGMDGFVRVCRSTLPALAEASRVARRAWPEARHVWVDACERHSGDGTSGGSYAALANDRRFFVIDAILGRLDDGFSRPFVRDVLRHHGASLLRLEPGHIDVVGLDFYAHNQWHFGADRGVSHTPHPTPFDELIAEYAARYGRPVLVTETNLRGTGSDRASWFRYVLERTEMAERAGVDVGGVTWFPFIDSADWDSLLLRCEGNIDPVGVLSLDHRLDRRRSTLTTSFTAAAAGAPAASLPAYRFQAPVDRWLRGYGPQMAHWPWQDPPLRDRVQEHVDYDMEVPVRESS
jgi:beta-glucosidase/6-phospho-beta-glucosidase/beta-galactosidase